MAASLPFGVGATVKFMFMARTAYDGSSSKCRSTWGVCAVLKGRLVWTWI